ncbi:hypothetical protein OGAPHI_000451 [Ogataea philodendri]|uniref:Enoyl reductase (ER) domain-containing protein n=1 Tax=Ogataea philodendri TaxID=1378263 RepID=A0A9P8TAC7_9ASCO|nr:uncharacterized protein OGAPHI_000451 [Ogataea philodendri]KAH3671746.1 hypothetical protein OGAPHI_000451 [Ogataea philodendri]
MMKALCYSKPNSIAWKSVPKPVIKLPGDVIGKVLATTICGTDLHIVKGHVPESTATAEASPDKGLILGHEGIIQIVETGPSVSKFKQGDVCVVSCITSCGDCYYCAKDIQAHCKKSEGGSGWILGHTIDGTQAEFVRIPFADHSLYKAPQSLSFDSLLMLSDILPTAYEVGVLAGHVKKGDTVAIVGLGPVGLSALISAKALEPAKIIAIDLDDSRLQVAKEMGADELINSSKVDAKQQVHQLTTSDIKDSGVDVAIECVGLPPSFELCEELIAPGGHISNVGVHGSPVQLQLQNLWGKNVSLSTGLVSAYSTQALLDKVLEKKISPEILVTHHFKLDEFEKAYQVFGNAAANKAIKVVLGSDH